MSKKTLFEAAQNAPVGTTWLLPNGFELIKEDGVSDNWWIKWRNTDTPAPTNLLLTTDWEEARPNRLVWHPDYENNGYYAGKSLSSRVSANVNKDDGDWRVQETEEKSKVLEIVINIVGKSMRYRGFDSAETTLTDDGNEIAIFLRFKDKETAESAWEAVKDD